MEYTQEDLPIRLSSPPEIVGAIPYLIGFHPHESLVVVSMHGRRNRTGFSMRVDLPSPEFNQVFATEMVSRVAKEQADNVIMVCYTSAPDVGAGLPHADLVDAMLDELRIHEIGWTEVLLVRDGRWWSYTCDKPCCPRAGTVLPSSPSATLAQLEARSALAGVAVLAGRDELERSVRGPVAIRLVAMRQRCETEAERLADSYMEQGVDTVRQETLALVRTAFRAFLEGSAEIDDAAAARILLGLVDKWPRDVLITWGLDERAHEVTAFFTTLAQRAPDEYAAPVCTILGAVAYQHGSGALAAVALERALRAEPDYEMAQLLETLLARQVNPAEIRAMARRVEREMGRHGIDDDRPAAA